MIRRRVGRNVQRLRNLTGLSQEELAEKAGNSGKHIGDIERGTANVGIDVLIALADYFAVPVASFFGPDPRRGTAIVAERDLDAMRSLGVTAARIDRARAAARARKPRNDAY